MINSSSLNDKRPRTDTDVVTRPGGDLRQKDNARMLLLQQEDNYYMHHQKQ